MSRHDFTSVHVIDMKSSTSLSNLTSSSSNNPLPASMTTISGMVCACSSAG